MSKENHGYDTAVLAEVIIEPQVYPQHYKHGQTSFNHFDILDEVFTNYGPEPPGDPQDYIREFRKVKTISMIMIFDFRVQWNFPVAT